MTLGEGLKASAGSGKTFNLSSRFIAIFLKGKFENKSNLNQILALTFTTKAASEMKKKIIQTFFDLENKDELNLICSLTKLDKSTILMLRDENKDEFLNADLKISTYDSFFNSVLRIFALNAGINPNFEISDINKDVEKKFIQKFSKDLILKIFLVDYLYKDEKNSLSNLIDKLTNFKIKACEFKKNNANFPSDENIKKILKNMSQIAQDSNMNQLAIKAFEFSNVKEILTKAICKYDDLGSQKNFKKNFNPNLEKLYSDFKFFLKQYCDELQDYEFDNFGKILDDFHNTKIEINRQKNCLDFNDVTNFVSEILCDKELDKDFLYFRLDGKINHILLDEFQDTNVVQYKILYPLIDEILSGFGQKDLGSFFYVGDTKQSIYRFRNSKKELFDKLKFDFKDKISVKNLDTNYRSCKNLVEFINDIFKEKYPDFSLQKANNQNNGLIRVFKAPKIINEDKIDGLQSIANSVLQIIKDLQSFGIKNNDICVLCWKNSDIDFLRDFLNKSGIPTSGDGAKLLFDIKEVRGLVDFARFCVTGEELYLIESKKLLGLKELPKITLNLNKSVSQTMIFLSQKIGLDLSNKNILEVILFAKKYNNLIDFLFNENKQKSLSNSDFGVKLMTTHASKGLEFDHLIVCDKTSRSRNNSDEILCEFDIKTNTWEKFLKINKRENIDKNYKNFIEKIEKFDNEEELNKIYVALTRAKISLTIIKNPDETKNSYFEISTKDEVKSILELPDLILPSNFDDFNFDDKKAILTQNYKNILEDKPQKKEPKRIILPKNEKQEILQLEEKFVDKTSAIFGTVLHFVLELMSNFTEKSLQNSLQKARNLYSKNLNNSQFLDIESRIKLLLKDEKFLKILQNAEIIKEQSFKINNEIKRLDLVALKKDEVVIVDYKSGKNSEKNVKQVEFYKECLKKFYKDKKVFAYLIYLNEEISFLEV